MAIAYARMEFVKRSEGKTACAKSAYNSRSEVEFEGNCVLDPKRYSWDGKELPAHHEVLLPEGANDQFSNPTILWNAAEAKERRLDAQVAMELVLALPDDAGVSVEDRIKLVQGFVREHFTDNGLAAQIDIHAPEDKIEFAKDFQKLGIWKGMYGTVLDVQDDVFQVALEKGGKRIDVISFDAKEFNGFSKKDHNWHAHVLITTRRFAKDGQGFESHKARDLMPKILRGKVVEGPQYGKLWAQHQNLFFEEKGWSLRVDPEGIVPQEHLGPVRMRARAIELLNENERLVDLNKTASLDSSQILQKMTEVRSVFTERDVDHFIDKHVPAEEQSRVKANFWKEENLVALLNKKGAQQTPVSTGKYTSQAVIDEDRRILRLAEGLAGKSAHSLKRVDKQIRKHGSHLNEEQRSAVDQLLKGERLMCVQGYAGTGKSTMLKTVHDAYRAGGYTVRAFGPDSSTAQVLKEKGFSLTENIYRFLFAEHYGKRKIAQGKEVWILDEAGKVGNQSLGELLRAAKSRGAQLILSGDVAQLPAVQRGGAFKEFTERFSTVVLSHIQRQSGLDQREISRELATGEIGHAIDQLYSKQCLHWSADRLSAMEDLISKWSSDRTAFKESSHCIIAHTNEDIRVLNELARSIRLSRGEISEKEYKCETSRGVIYVSEGDTLEFRKNDRDLGVTNGLSGKLIEASREKFTVAVDRGGKHTEFVSFDPRSYNAFQLGYASTYHRAQGRTVDRAYVLHSPYATKEMFYVGLTRHVKKVHCFLSRGETPDVASLKTQVLREDRKETTLRYTTEQMESQKHLEEAATLNREMLKASDSSVDRIKGHFSSGLHQAKSWAKDVVQSVKDKRPDKSFYKPQIEKTSSDLADIEESSDRASRIDLESSNENPGRGGRSTIQASRETSLEKSLVPNEISQERIKTSAPLTEPNKALVERYFKAAHQTSLAKQVVDAKVESSGKDQRHVRAFSAWQKQAGERNELAFELRQSLGSSAIKQHLGEKAWNMVLSQAALFEETQERKAGASISALDGELRGKIRDLVDHLFHERPSQVSQREIRFGSKGSLTVALSGQDQGSFYDFEEQKGGGPITLIERQKNCSRKEAIAWAQDFVGGVRDLPPSMGISIQHSSPQQPRKGGEWVSLTPTQKHPAPALDEIPGKKLHLAFNEVARHAYRDESGNLLYYVLRLQDKKDPNHKITPPLSYGHVAGDSSKPSWNLKGYAQGNRSLYNIHLLREHPNATVLVVEGEKTADKARERFPNENVIAVSWSGGAGAVNKADWSPLFGRSVIVWPDNDPAGFKAGKEVCDELKRAGVGELSMVKSGWLEKNLPQKWDLANPLPGNLKESTLVSRLHMSESIAVPSAKLYARLVHKEMVGEENFLWRVRCIDYANALSDRLGMSDAQQISNEAFRVISMKGEVSSYVSQLLKDEGDLAQRVTDQVVNYRIRTGEMPSDEQIKQMKGVIGDTAKACSQSNALVGLDQQKRNFVQSRATDEACNGIFCRELPNTEETLNQAVMDAARFGELSASRGEFSKESEQQRGLEVERGRGFSI